jgi:CDP-glucose 4,6-dehydratase
MGKRESSLEGLGMNLEFYKGKRVFVTGHTGFKGSWLCRTLINFGAEVSGYSLSPPTEPNLFSICGIKENMNSIIGDIRDASNLFTCIQDISPEIVFHMAAQPIVRESYTNPVYTYETNVMGTINVLEALRKTESIKSFLNITTDKVYLNREWEWGYRENDILDGFDPYSNSKSCSELVTHCYQRSFFLDNSVSISTARAGNVIGGGDFSKDRIIPDCVRAAVKNEPIIVRNPYSTRPYQHVLESLSAYLLIAQKQYENIAFSGCYNIGPDDSDCVMTKTLVELFCKKWGNNQTWENKSTGGPHEANFLKLDCSKLKKTFGWAPIWSIDRAVEKTVEWNKAYLADQDMTKVMDKQIEAFFLNS